MGKPGGETATSYRRCIGFIREAAAEFPDTRTGRNIHHTIHDAVMSAYAVFFFQSPSWLSCQRALQDEKGKSNALTLFDIKAIPTDNHVRRLLDPASPELLNGTFRKLQEVMDGSGALERYRVLGGRMPVALDGMDFHSSQKISCPNCLVARHRDGRTVFSHKAVTPVIVAPGIRQAVPLRPEFVVPQDGAQKQDCEINASKRWLDDMAVWLRKARAVLLGDDLYAHGPFCRKVLLHGLHFIFTCLRESHKATYEWLDLLKPCDFQTVSETRMDGDRRKRTWAVRFAKGVPLSGEDGALCVNWLELTVTDAKGRQTYRNCWATDMDVDAGNAVEMAACGRARWVIENGNNNVLKTKGYHLDHNFGHGKKHLANTLAAINILAFLTHTVLELTERHYRLIRERLGSRREFFLHLHVLSVYHLFQSWEDFEDFMMKAHGLGPHAPAATPELTTKGLLRRNTKRKSR
ncbi:MAG: ISNCY family transposase [bacterium]